MASVSKTATKDGKTRWRARWRGPDGRSHERWFLRRVDAQKFVAAVDLGGHQDPLGARRPLGAVVDAWVDGAAPRPAPKTVASYRSLARLLTASLGARRVGALTTLELQQAVARWQTQGLSASRIRQAVHLLGQALDQLMADGVIGRNPTAGVRLPPLPSARTAGFTPEQADRIVAALPAHHRLLGEVVAHCGLRWAEAAGLTVGQIDVTRCRILVDRSLSQVDGRLHERTTKSGRARTVPITSDLAGRLQEATAGLSGNARVFVATKGGPLLYDNWRRDVWVPTVTALGLAGGVHGLRKAAITRWLRAGVAPHIAARLAGHTDVNITLRVYAEVADQDLDQAAELMNRGAVVGLGPSAASIRGN